MDKRTHTTPSSTETSVVQKEIAVSDPISGDALHTFHLAMSAPWFFICISGITANMVNIYTFNKIGLKDTVTISFFVLAISDLCTCSFALLDMSCFFGYLMGIEFNLFLYLPPFLVAFFFLILRRMFNTYTILITTFLAVQRCFAVVLPLQVKDIFTRERTFGYFGFIFVFSGTFHILFISQHYAFETKDAVTNRTYLTLYVPESKEPIPFMTEIFFGMIVNISCQIIVICCLIFMRIGLKRSENFRNKNRNTPDPTLNPAKSVVADSEQNTVQEDSKNVRSKQSQAVIQVSFVSIIFVITNMPFLSFALANLLKPEIDMLGAWHNVYVLLHNIMFTAELINSSVNFIIYFNYNTKFRNSLRDIWVVGK